MAALFALVAACSWGGSDFLGGLAGRRAGRDISLPSALIGSGIGLVGLTIIAAAVGGASMSARDVTFAVGAGIGSAVGVSLLFRGLTIGTMGVVAPITGIGAVALPVLVGTVSGDTPSRLAWAGIALAVGAIVLASREPSSRSEAGGTRRRGRPAGLPEAIGSGLGFGTLFTLLGQTAEATNLWPLVPLRLATVLALLLAVMVTRTGLTTPRRTWPYLVGIGVLDNLANVAYLLATRRGLLSLVAVVSSLYPVATVVLARVVLQERLARQQVLGLALAVLAVGLISVA